MTAFIPCQLFMLLYLTTVQKTSIIYFNKVYSIVLSFLRYILLLFAFLGTLNISMSRLISANKQSLIPTLLLPFCRRQKPNLSTVYFMKSFAMCHKLQT